MKRRYRLAGIMAAVLLAAALLLTGCGSPGLTQENSTAQGGATSVSDMQQIPPDSQPEGEGNTARQEAVPAGSSAPGETHAPAPDSDGGQNEPTPAPTQQAPSESAQEPVRQGVSLSVTCHTAVANGLHKLPQYQGNPVIVPASGVIYEGDMLALEDGDTALSLLKRTMDANGIKYSVQRGYVRGINYLFQKEKDYPNSGWLYRVNGVFPNIGCDKYVLKPGDRVEFLYTCVQGDLKN